MGELGQLEQVTHASMHVSISRESERIFVDRDQILITSLPIFAM